MRLCIVTATLGQPTETFVKRHIELLSKEPVFVICRSVHDLNNTQIEDSNILVLNNVDKLTPLGGFRMLLKSLFLYSPGFLLTKKHKNAIVNFLDEKQIDVVLLEFLDASLPFLKILTNRGIFTIAHGHGSDVSSRLKRWWWRYAYKRYENIPVVVVSKRSKIRLHNLCKLKLELLHVIPCAPIFEPNKTFKTQRNQLSGSAVRVLSIGRLVSKKDPLGLIEVLKIAIFDLNLDVYFTIIGEGPLSDLVKSRIIEYGLEHRINMAGELDNEQVIEMLMSSNIYIQNSRVDPITGEEEGLPVSLLEAMSAGLPVIATNHAGIPEVIEDKISGILVPECSYIDMANALFFLIKNPELAKKIGYEAQKVVKNQINWDIEKENLLSLFDSRKLHIESGRNANGN